MQKKKNLLFLNTVYSFSSVIKHFSTQMKFNGDRIKLNTKMVKTTSVLFGFLGHKKPIVSSRESVQMLMRVMKKMFLSLGVLLLADL